MLAHSNIFYICVCLIISLLLGIWYRWKASLFPFKWCHTWKNLARIRVVQLNNMTELPCWVRQLILLLSLSLKFWCPRCQSGTCKNGLSFIFDRHSYATKFNGGMIPSAELVHQRFSTTAPSVNTFFKVNFPACHNRNTHLAACFFFVVGFLLCHNSLNTNQASQELWKMALRSGFHLKLTRDELLNIHKVSEDLFDNIKGYERCSLCGCCSVRTSRC